MKIAMFTDCYRPVINGVVTSVVNLKTALEKLGHSVYIFAPKVSGYKDAENSIYRFFSFPYLFQREHRVSFPFPRKIFKQIKDLKIDVIHIHSPFCVGFMGLATASKNKTPAVFSHHTLWEKYVHYFPLFSQGLREKIAIKLCRHFANKSKQVIAPTKQIKELLKTQGAKTPIQVIPSGIKLEDFKKTDTGEFKKKFPQLAGKKILIYVGRIGKEKNLEFLLKAFKEISNLVPESHFLLMGDGPYRKELEDIARTSGLTQKVTFSGYVPQEEVKHYLKASYVFVFSSLTETQGIVLQEAMAAGAPAVALKAPGADDTITSGEDGFLLEPDDIDGFVKRTIELLKSPHLRDQMSQKALKKAESFSQEKLVHQILEVYHKATTPVAESATGG